jgi:hypothetical protein
MMTYRVGIAETLHVTGDVPVEGDTIHDIAPNLPFQAIHLGEYSEQRFDILFSGPLADQRATLTRLADALNAAAIRVGWLQDAKEKALIAAHADTPMGLEDDLAGADQ